MEVKHLHSTKLFYDRALGIHLGTTEIKVPTLVFVSLENSSYPSKKWKCESIDLFHVTSVLEELIPHLSTQEFLLSLSHTNFLFCSPFKSGPRFWHLYKKPQTKTCLPRVIWKKSFALIFFQFFCLFLFPCKKSLGVSVLPSLSSSALGVSDLRVSPDHARGRADSICPRWVVAAMVHRLGVSRCCKQMASLCCSARGRAVWQREF